MTTSETGHSAAVAPAIGISAGMSALGGIVVWFTTSDVGYALTAATIGLVIGLAIFFMVAAGSRRT